VYIKEMGDDFAVFLEIIFPYIGLKAHPCQLEFARFVSSPHERKLAMAQRDMGKSNCLAALVCWYLYRDPDDTIVVASATEKRAVDICRQAKNLIKACPLLQHMAPAKDDLDGERRFNVGNRTIKAAKDPSVSAYGINAGMTGAHGNKVIGDDLEIPENSMTPEAREKIRERVRGFESIINDGHDTSITLVGTPQTMESFYFDLVADGIYHLYRVPAQIPETQTEISMLGLPGWVLDAMESGKMGPGDPTYPERFPPDELAKRQVRMGSSMYTLQFMLDPSASDADRYPLKLADLMVTDLGDQEAPPRLVWGNTSPARDIRSPGLGVDHFYRPVYVSPPNDWIPYEHGVMWIDPAGYGGDEVGYCIAKALGGYAYILRAGGLAGGYSDATMRRLIGLAQECDIRRIIVEKNWSDGLYGKQLQSMIGLLGLKMAVEGETVKGQKESRIIDTLEPVMNAHRLVVDTRVAKDYELMYQMSHITRERGCLRKDDRIDAVAGAVAMLKPYLFRNADQSIQDYENELFQADVREFQKLCGVAVKPKPRRWFRV
jgi:hypothetical protein